jgi:hypothetical protein
MVVHNHSILNTIMIYYCIIVIYSLFHSHDNFADIPSGEERLESNGPRLNALEKSLLSNQFPLAKVLMHVSEEIALFS